MRVSTCLEFHTRPGDGVQTAHTSDVRSQEPLCASDRHDAGWQGDYDVATGAERAAAALGFGQAVRLT